METSTNSAESHLLTRERAAEYVTWRYGLPCSKRAMAEYAVRGTGPAFQIFGRNAVYAVEAIDAWVSARLGPPQSHTHARRPADEGLAA